MATLRDYSPSAVSMTWGAIGFTGFGEDTFITVSRNEDNSNNTVGADGSVGITVNANKSGTVEVTLMQTSPTHRYLSAIQLAQDADDTVFRANMTVKDPSGGFLCKVQNAHILTPPEVSLGSDQNEKTWTFFAERIDYTDAPSGFTEVVGEISQIDDAISQVKDISDKLFG